MKIKENIKQNAKEIEVEGFLPQTPAIKIKIKSMYKSISLFSDLTFEDFKQHIENQIQKRDPLYLLTFIKNPTRQNIYEPLQLKAIEEYLSIKIKKTQKKFKNTKTFDGISEDETMIFNCKYIKESGGAQDNQFNDLIKFNQPSEYKTNYLIISGEYGIKKMKTYVKSNSLCSNVYVILLDEAIEVIKPNPFQKTKHYSKNSLLIKHLHPIPEEVVEPFVGEGDLLKLLNVDLNKVRCYDITQPKAHFPCFEQKDTLKENILREDDYVITNPPYTAKNKLSNELKERYKNYNYMDLYQILIQQLIQTHVKGGVLILPINFLLGKQTQKIRQDFLKIYSLQIVNIFEFPIFEKTTQAIITIQFIKKSEVLKSKEIEPEIYLFKSIDEEIKIKQSAFISIFDYFPLKTNFKIKRFYNTTLHPTRIRIHLIDTKEQIHAELLDEIPTKQDIISDRAILTIATDEEIDEAEIVKNFNKLIEQYRSETYSLSLSSFREYQRKRLTFEEAIHLINYLLNMR